jgi:hypothetical protein
VETAPVRAAQAEQRWSAGAERCCQKQSAHSGRAHSQQRGTEYEEWTSRPQSVHPTGGANGWALNSGGSGSRGVGAAGAPPGGSVGRRTPRDQDGGSSTMARSRPGR